jgi:hypothetical protein
MQPAWGFSARPMSRSWRERRKRREPSLPDLDYPRLLTLAQTTKPSLILFRDGDWSEAAVIAHMGEVLAALTEEDITRSIIVVDHFRVRRRRLPIGG